MRNCKLSITIALSCFLAASPAKAFWPVFDFAEIPAGIITQVLTSAQNLSEMKSQISELTENLRAIGDTCQTISQFRKDLYMGDDTGDVASATGVAVDKTLATSIVVQDKVITAANGVNDAHKAIINKVVSQIEQEIKVAAAETSIKLAQNDIYTPYIEENEEEIVDTNKEKENLQNFFAAVKKENQQLYVKMNDLFESSISVMNDSADLNHQALSTLEQAIEKSEQKVNENERKELQERTAALLNREQENSDLGISLMESVQNKYSKQYQEKIADNLSNYQKMVQAYLDGNVTAQELREAGTNLKAEVNAIDIFDDSNIFAQYNKENAEVHDSTSKLVEDVKRVWAEDKDNS